jgi:YfiH family protein
MNKINHFFTTKQDGNIKANKNNLTKFDINFDNIHYMNQTHSDNIVIIDKNSPSCIYNCDAILTKQLNTPLITMIADCIPILIYDTNHNAIGAIHAGRVGSFLKIAKKSVLRFSNTFNIKTKDIKAIFGASIQQCCHQIGDDIAKEVKEIFGEKYITNNMLNLPAINKQQLLDVGILEENISISNICTKCTNDYFSYREDNSCGRFAGIIELR